MEDRILSTLFPKTQRPMKKDTIIWVQVSTFYPNIRSEGRETLIAFRPDM